jgi:hypothetical protein
MWMPEGSVSGSSEIRRAVHRAARAADEAIAALCAEADESRVRMESRLAAEIPSPRGAAEETAQESAQGLGSESDSEEESEAEDSVNA